jgi:Uma2 family endonuclease
MVATAIQEKIHYHTNAHSPRRISWEEFEKKFLSREDNFKYEWVEGIVEKTPRPINQYQYAILDNIEAFFYQLVLEQKASGKFYAEIDTFFLDKVHRRPDSAYFDNTQRALMQQKINQIPRFVLEIISDNDNLNKFFKKLQNYRAAQVEVVWIILPELKEVYVYQGGVMTHCFGDMVCSAAPVLPLLQIPVKDIFKPLVF